MDGLSVLFQDWFGILFSTLSILGLVGMWIGVLSRKITDKNGGLTPDALGWFTGAIIVSFVVGGCIALMWGGRAYLTAHRTEANNAHVQMRAEEVKKATEIDYEMVEQERRRRKWAERQRCLEDEQQKNAEARESSEDYFESLEGKGDK